MVQDRKHNLNLLSMFTGFNTTHSCFKVIFFSNVRTGSKLDTSLCKLVIKEPLYLLVTVTSPPQPLASGLFTSEDQARTPHLALLEAQERVHVGAAAAVVVRFANVVPMGEKPPWLLK